MNRVGGWFRIVNSTTILSGAGVAKRTYQLCMCRRKWVTIITFKVDFLFVLQWNLELAFSFLCCNRGQTAEPPSSGMPQDQKSLSYGVCIYSKSSSTEEGVEFIYEFEYARVLAKYISFGAACGLEVGW